MMVLGKEDIGLSLSLGFSSNNTSTSATATNNNLGFRNLIHNHHHHLNLQQQQTTSLNLTMMPAVPSSHSPLLQNLPWNRSTDSFPPSSDRTSETCRPSFLKGIDVNRPAAADEDEAGVSSPNSTVSTVSGKRSAGERDSAGGDDIEVERDSSRGLSDDEDGGENSRKKLRLTKDQSAILEESFKEHNTLNPKQKMALAKRLGLRPRQVEVWFQNRRARTKLKQTEVDCEFLKRCCEQLTEDNRRLQKEVAELRALKLSPQFYMQMPPPTTLTMCPSCERVAAPPPSGAASLPPASHQRPMPVNSWVAAPVTLRPFDALRNRS